MENLNRLGLSSYKKPNTKFLFKERFLGESVELSIYYCFTFVCVCVVRARVCVMRLSSGELDRVQHMVQIWSNYDILIHSNGDAIVRQKCMHLNFAIFAYIPEVNQNNAIQRVRYSAIASSVW